MQLQFKYLTQICTIPGKRPHRQHVKTTLAAGFKQGSRLFYIQDKNTGYLFLVDTGAQISLIPPDPKQKIMHHPIHSKLQMDRKSKHTERYQFGFTLTFSVDFHTGPSKNTNSWS